MTGKRGEKWWDFGEEKNSEIHFYTRDEIHELISNVVKTTHENFHERKNFFCSANMKLRHTFNKFILRVLILLIHMGTATRNLYKSRKPQSAQPWKSERFIY